MQHVLCNLQLSPSPRLSHRVSAGDSRHPLAVLVWVAVIVGMFACHHPVRNNPFDPVLTPAVRLLSVEVDRLAGTATLIWTPYEGTEPFAAYQIFRRIVKSTEVDTLTTITAVTETTYVDDTLAPETEYLYWVVAQNPIGFGVESNELRSEAFGLTSVRLDPVAVEAQTGTASVRWTSFAGPDFEMYRIERRYPGIFEWEERGRHLTVRDTTFVDTDLLADVRYFYRVAVYAAGRVLTSNEWEVEYSLPAVALLRVQAESRTATATVTWSQYEGPRFQAYEVWRRTGQTREGVFRTEEVGTTTFEDHGLQGNTDYGYTVVVHDQANATSESEERHGSFHRFLKAWELGVAPAALVIDPAEQVSVARWAPSVDLWWVNQYDLAFQLQRAMPLYPYAPAAGQGQVDLVTDAAGNLYGACDLAAGTAEGDGAVVKFDPSGQLIWATRLDMEGAGMAGIAVTPEQTVLVVSREGHIFAVTSEGQEVELLLQTGFRGISAVGLWEETLGLAVPGLGQIRTLIRESAGGTIYSSTGWIGRGIGPEVGQLLTPTSMVRGDADRLFVVNGEMGRLEVFKGNQPLTTVGTTGQEAGEFFFIEGGVFRGDVALDRGGKIYVADTANRRIQMFEP